MARIPKVSLAELQQLSTLSDEHVGDVHYLIRRATEQGIEGVDSKAILNIARFGAALSELSVVLLHHHQMNLEQADLRRQLSAEKKSS